MRQHAERRRNVIAQLYRTILPGTYNSSALKRTSHILRAPELADIQDLIILQSSMSTTAPVPATDLFNVLPTAVLASILTGAITSDTADQRRRAVALFRLVSKACLALVTEEAKLLHLNPSMFYIYEPRVLRSFSQLTTASIVSSDSSQSADAHDHIHDFEALGDNITNLTDMEFTASYPRPIHIWSCPELFTFAENLASLSLHSCEVHTGGAEEGHVHFKHEDFRKLKNLRLTQVFGMKELTLAGISSLQRLDLESNHELNIVNLPLDGSLSHLSIESCSLISMDCTEISSLYEVKFISNLNLFQIDMSECSGLQRFQSMDNPSLSYVHFTDCSSLIDLHVSDCRELSCVDLQQCTRLDFLLLHNVGTSTLHLPIQHQFLKRVHLHDTLLKEAYFNNCSSLEFIEVSCNSRMLTADISNNSMLKTLHTSDNGGMVRMRMVHNKALTGVIIDRNQSLVELDVHHSFGIQTLDLFRLPLLIESLQLPRMSRLRKLRIDRMPLCRVLQVKECRGLESMRITNCKGLRRVSTRGRTVKLTFINCAPFNMTTFRMENR